MMLPDSIMMHTVRIRHIYWIKLYSSRHIILSVINLIFYLNFTFQTSVPFPIFSVHYWDLTLLEVIYSGFASLHFNSMFSKQLLHPYNGYKPVLNFMTCAMSKLPWISVFISPPHGVVRTPPSLHDKDDFHSECFCMDISPSRCRLLFRMLALVSGWH